jgi:RNA polymerase sigma-70 factor (ECF subfamily)
MEDARSPIAADVLLRHGQFLRDLAVSLARHGLDADDLVQETYAAALRAPPADLSRPLGPWLGRVLRNAFRSTLRAASRRQRRELEAAAAEAPPTAEDTLARIQLHREIVDLFTALDEPYRTTLLLRFYEGKDASEIGRSMNAPAATVRWRLAKGLEQIREGLDARHGERARWRALVPVGILAGRHPRSVPPTRAPAGPGALMGGTLALALAGAAVWLSWPSQRPGHPPQESSASISQETRPEDPRPEDPRMIESKKTLAKATAFLAVALPALAASAQNAPEPSLRDARVEACMEVHRQVYACDQAFADLFIKDVPAERQAAARSKVLAEIARKGSGPEAPRRQSCADTVDKSPPVSPARVQAFAAVLADCRSRADCHARAACLWPSVLALRQRR